MGSLTAHRYHPSVGEIHLALGPAYPLWKRLTHFLETHSESAGEWSAWGPANCGWGLRYRSRGKALAALYPQEGWIIAQVVLGKAQAERALGLELGEQVSRVLKETPQLRDGRWLSIAVRDELDAGDVEQLVLVKIRPAGRRA